jgi:hypothetical protein
MYKSSDGKSGCPSESTAQLKGKPEYKLQQPKTTADQGHSFYDDSSTIIINTVKIETQTEEPWCKVFINRNPPPALTLASDAG